MFRGTRILAAAVVSLALALVAGALPAHAQKRIALLIGNQTYLPEVGRLANPHNDIALLEKTLKALGFQVVTVRDASLSGLHQAVNQHVRRVRAAGPNAVGFFYYSGHGAQDASTGINYLIPTDVISADDGELWDASLQLAEITRKLKRDAGNATHFVVFDACRNALKLKQAGKSALVQSKGFVPVAQENGMLIAYATAEGELASDAGQGAGPYAKVLAEEIVKPGIEAVVMFRAVQRRVREAIGQEPYLGFSALGDVYLAGLEPPRPPPVVAAPQPPPPVPALRLSEAAEAWDRTKDTTNLAVLEAFIARYKDTFYADLARARVDDLKKQQVALAPPPAKSEPAPAAKKTPGLIDQTLGIVLPPPSKQAPLNAPAGRCDGAQIAVGTANERRCVKPGAGKTEWFKDCPACPEMVVVPAGRFTMGSPAAEPERSDKEGPQKTVVFQKPFAVARVEVTIEQFDAFVTAAGQSPPGDCRTTDNIGRADRNYRDPGYGMTPIHPAACISWEDAVAYTAWLSKTTGKKYRLLSEAEWEYSARAGSTTAFWWGNEIGTNNANCHRCGSMWDSKQTAPVGSFASNAFGLHDMHGNVWEWVADCWNTYDSAKSDGWATADYQECHRAHRGGSFPEYSRFARSASRSVFAPNTRHYNGGFRVARTLD